MRPQTIAGVPFPCERVGPVQGSKSPKSGKEGFGVQKLPFPSASEKGDLSQKIPIFLVEPCRDMGIFDPNRPFLTHWEMGVFGLRNPLFPILGILTPVQGRRVRNPSPFPQQLTYGVVSEGVFAESLRKFCGKFAETRFYCARKGCGNSAESLRKFRGNLRKIFCNDPFPNDPISELLISLFFLDRVTGNFTLQIIIVPGTNLNSALHYILFTANILRL